MNQVLEHNATKDKEVLLSIVKEMAESITGEQSTRHWSKDVLWFDIPAFASKGHKPALDMFNKVFSSFKSCKVDILHTEVMLNGDMGVVCTVQRVHIELKTGDKKVAMVRQTDIFERRHNKWELIHEHASSPAGGEWDGKIITA